MHLNLPDQYQTDTSCLLHPQTHFVQLQIKNTADCQILEQVDLDACHRSDFSTFKCTRLLGLSDFLSGGADQGRSHSHGSSRSKFGLFAGLVDIGNQAPVVNFTIHRLLQTKLFKLDYSENALDKIYSNTNSLALIAFGTCAFQELPLQECSVVFFDISHFISDQLIKRLSHIVQALSHLGPNVLIARYQLHTKQTEEGSSPLCVHHSIFHFFDRPISEEVYFHNAGTTSTDQSICLRESFKPSSTKPSETGDEQSSSSRPDSPSLDLTVVGVTPNPEECNHKPISINLPDDEEPFEVDPDIWQFLHNKQQQYPQYWLSCKAHQDSISYAMSPS
ncbi:uncharacterized protein MELLADRAFT_92221 [Melampsora larici-populina 98AG31]|uniref:Uncharacterized protein n=1 Tax=Melampsora larici-populina (strain 98AG31 / pathotype 3-4-7) TaxID=747676 RepID=F4R8U9_MELLP|nr:uncharacterized protein MELLADRAFT_92221 [Melampsora larici-populina 98AG31]EGG10871.1 hypothetical protein MELLADRAFT_92221 [Melampsora larici-populina 98AG31]